MCDNINMDSQSCWKRINEEIKKHGMTQRSLALQCGFTERRIESLSAANRYPDAIEITKIAQALGTSVEYLVTGAESDPYKEKFDTLVIAVRNLPVD